MPDPEAMRATMRRYLALVEQNDVDGVLELMSDDVSVEDPVGGPPGTHVVGREAVAAFFRQGFRRARPAPELTGPIVSTGANAAAMSFTLRLDLAGSRQAIDVVDVMTFDEDGRIASLRAFWNPREGRPV